MKKSFGICLISLLILGSSCASRQAHDSAQEGAKEASSCCLGSDKAGHDQATHDHKNCTDGACGLEKKAKN